MGGECSSLSPIQIVDDPQGASTAACLRPRNSHRCGRGARKRAAYPTHGRPPRQPPRPASRSSSSFEAVCSCGSLSPASRPIPFDCWMPPALGRGRSRDLSRPFVLASTALGLRPTPIWMRSGLKLVVESRAPVRGTYAWPGPRCARPSLPRAVILHAHLLRLLTC